MVSDVRTNALDDLLDAERHFRQQAEQNLRELRNVLVDLAQRLAGNRIEDCRRIDPAAPESWNSGQWKSFFTSLPVTPANESWGRATQLEIERTQAENRELKERLAFLEKVVTNPVSSIDHTPADEATQQAGLEPGSLQPGACTNPAEIQPELTEKVSSAQTLTLPVAGFHHSELALDLRSLPIPSAVPVRFDNRFPKAGLKEVDWTRQLRRKLYALYLLSRGMDIRLEIDHLISQVEGIGSRTGALRRIYDNMVEKNLISINVMEMSAPNTSLAMLNLTEDGRELCRIMNWETNETERERLNRLHEGQQYPQHSLAILIFAMHARFRGYRASVLPEVSGLKTNAVPDVWINQANPTSGAESLYVEVELSNKELPEKWQNLSQLQGRVALCARNLQRRARLVGDCKLKNWHGVATDLETLITPKVPEITPDTPLWVDTW